MRIKSTAWAKKFKRECPLQYDNAIFHVTQDKAQVFIDRNNDRDADVWQYAIIVDRTDFWLDAFPTSEESVKLCNRM